MKKLISLILIFAAMAALCLPVSAARVSAAEAIHALETLELVRGTGSGFEPQRSATRAEAVVMLLRLLGQENAAKAETEPSPFTDGGWADAYLSYAWKTDLVRGKGGGCFGSDEAVGIRDYLTMVLRALGYSDAAGDFSWKDSLAFAEKTGLVHGEYFADAVLIREDLALISYTALTLPVKNSGLTLIERLYLDGVVSADALKQTRLVWALEVGKPVYSAAEIHELSASAVFYVEMFETEENLEKNKAASHGSGFFISGDGLALLSYHELDGYAYARATTLDGKCYDITGVLAYDPLWDMAVVQVSRQATDGSSVRFFPWLDLGDSDAVYPGEVVYAVTNPLGLVDSISEGVISNRSRNVDDPDYPCIQLTASIAQGSSGGPVLDSHGAVIGIVHGMYVKGQLLNLATPVNCIPVDACAREAMPLTAVKAAEDEKKEAAEITASQTELELLYGESVEIMVTHTCPGTANIQYELDNYGVVECEWGSFVTKHSVPLTVTAVNDGETEIEITFASGHGNETASLTIHVSVSGTPAEEE